MRSPRICTPRASAAFHRVSPATAANRWTKRDRTAGAPACLAARERMTSGAPSPCAKSCADRPTRSSGKLRPSSSRIGRLSHGSLRVSGGQVPSFNPPSTSRSTLCRRASSRPKIRIRGLPISGTALRAARRELMKNIGIIGAASSSVRELELSAMISKAAAADARPCRHRRRQSCRYLRAFRSRLHVPAPERTRLCDPRLRSSSGASATRKPFNQMLGGRVGRPAGRNCADRGGAGCRASAGKL